MPVYVGSRMLVVNPTLAINLNEVAILVRGKTADDPIEVYMTATGPDGSNRIVIEDKTVAQNLIQSLFPKD